MRDFILLNSKSGTALRWVPPNSFSFLASVPLLPVHAAEAGRIGSALPLALCGEPDQPSGWTLVAVCGREPKSNTMVSGSGQWLAKSVPDSVRYLPFALKNIGGGKALAAIDPRYAGKVLVPRDPAVSLYGEDGEMHAAARKRVEYLAEHQPKISRTQEILALLEETGLIVPWPEAALNAGGITLEGLHTIDEKKLSQLDDDAFLALRRSGALATAYSCLLSLYQVRNFASTPRGAKPNSETAVQTTGDLDLEFLNEDETIKFGPLR